MKHSILKKGKQPPSVEGSIVCDWERLVNFGKEGAMVREPPPKKKIAPTKKMIYKCPRARKFFYDMSTLHSVEELRELLVAGVSSGIWG